MSGLEVPCDKRLSYTISIVQDVSALEHDNKCRSLSTNISVVPIINSKQGDYLNVFTIDSRSDKPILQVKKQYKNLTARDSSTSTNEISRVFSENSLILSKISKKSKLKSKCSSCGIF